MLSCVGSGISCAYNMFSWLYQYSSLDKRIKSYKEYIELEQNYQFLLKELQQSLYELGIVQPMEIYAVFHYMTQNGFLSLGHKFYFDNSDRGRFLYGTSIINGFGVCRNLSVFLTDLLTEFQYESYSVEMSLMNQKLYYLSTDI